MDEKRIGITFYFVSGENVTHYLVEDLYDQLMTCLQKGWNSCQVTGEDWGINCSLVTHYEVKE